MTEPKEKIFNPSLEKGIDYITSAVRTCKAQTVKLELHRYPEGHGSVWLSLDYDKPLPLIKTMPADPYSQLDKDGKVKND